MLWAWLSLGAAVYLTLLPFEFGDVSLEKAWEVYRDMPLTGPGAGGRAQFMANVLMFAPLGFFWTAWLTHGHRGGLRAMTVFVLVAALGLTVTATVEFLQVWLPLRHPAGADIAGNFLGAVAGAAAWLALRNLLLDWRARLSGSGARPLTAALVLYAAAYVVAGLLPFDLVLSQEELAARLASDDWGWWVADGACDNGVRCVAWLALVAVASLPVGILLGLWLARHTRAVLAVGLPLALLLAAALELLNLATLSGTAEGRGVLLRASGLLAGLALAGHLPRQPQVLIRALQRLSMPLLVLVVPLYALALVSLNHGFGPYHGNLDAAAAQLGDLRLWPFYYHYHVGEVHALRSTALHLAMYLPLGALLWLAQLRRPLAPAALNTLAVAAGVLAALLMEGGKLFIDGARPDPASLVLAPLASWAMLALLGWLAAVSTPGPGDGEAAAPSPGPPATAHTLSEPAPPAGVTGTRWRLLGAGLGLGVLALALAWPVAGWALAAGLAVYVALLLWRLQAWLLVVPVLIATLDLTLYTGRLFVSELDLFLGMTLAVALWRWPRAGVHPPLLPRGLRQALMLLVLSTLIALALALWPARGWDAGKAWHFAHEWNALRVAGGLLWAVALAGTLRLAPAPPREQVVRWFLPGVALALLAKLALVVRERATWPGLLDFDSRYRISGLFSEMQAGGPMIEAFLVLALPLALIWCWQQRLPWLLGGTALLAAGTTYAIAVTYSRGGYLGLAVALLVLAAWRSTGGRGRRAALLIAALLPLLLAGTLAAPTLDGFAQQRLAQLQQDLGSRAEHWRLALDLPGAGTLAPVFGRGVGSFPAHYRSDNPEGRLPANFAYTREAGPPRLRLGSGDSLYLNQRVGLPRAGVFELQVRARSPEPAAFRAFVCEKPVRHSFECRSAALELQGHGDWETLAWEFASDGMDDRPWPLRRGLVLSLAHAGPDAVVVEFDHLTLTDGRGQEYLANGDFRELGRHWYFTTDHLWPWRVENQWLEIYFDQGGLGVLAFVWLTLAALVILLRRAVRGDPVALGAAAALAGALAIGLFGTLFFAPRIALLFYLVLLLGVAAGTATGRAAPRPATEASPRSHE